jgi:thiol-disulfide isomerase/thioredoxin
MIKKLLLLSIIFVAASCSNKGNRIPEFSLKTLDGKVITDKDLKGKIVVIDLWATWCGTCLSELEELNKLAEKYKQDSTVLFIAVSDETAEKVNSSLARRPFNFTHIPLAQQLTDALQTRLVKTYPQHIIVGKELTIEYELTNGLPNASEVLSKEIERLR